MQRLRQNLVLQLVRQAHVAPAVSPLPGLRQLATPALCALDAALPVAYHGPAPCTNLISLRSFAAAAEPCRIEDQQSAAEALFKLPADDQLLPVHQPVVYPFFARAYYVGEGTMCYIAYLSQSMHACMQAYSTAKTFASCRQLYQPGSADKASAQVGLPYLCGKGDGPYMCCC